MLVAYAENMQRLAAHAQLGGGSLSNLTTLVLYRLAPGLVEPFLRIVLTATTKLATLRTTAMRNASADSCITMVSSICDIAAEVSPGLANVEVGTFKIPDAFDCGGLLQQLVDGVNQRGLNAAIEIDFNDNVTKSMVNALSEAGIHGHDVTVIASPADVAQSGTGEFQLTWHNSGTGNQQKLKIRVKAPIH